jgi:SAM-dependent methyltransferase
MNDDAGDRRDIDAIYARRFPGEDDAHAHWRRELWRVLVDDYFSRWLPAEATVLDFGCGQGEFINAVRARRRLGVDQRSGLKGHLDEGVEFLHARDGRLATIASGEIDVVFCSNLLEHLPSRQAVTELLREFSRVLSPNGRLLVLGPNLRYTGVAYWDFFDHIVPLTELSLVEALATADLSVETLVPRFLPYTTVGSRLLPMWCVRGYLRVPLAWRFFGAQFFAVARPGA